MTKPFYQDEQKNITLYHGDCLDILPQLTQRFNTVLIDPPYYKNVKAAWDNQWESIGDFVNWLELVALQIKRVALSNANIYIFQSARWAAYAQVMLDKHFTYLNNMVWYKTNNVSIKFAHNGRRYAPMTERILFYTPELSPTGLELVKLDVNNFQELRKYFYDMLVWMGETSGTIEKKLGHRRAEHCFYVKPKPMTKSEVINTIGQKADHCFRYGSTQWELPTEQTYNELITVFGIDKWEGFIPYDGLRNGHGKLRAGYEAKRLEYEAKRRTFNATSQTLDVISGGIITNNKNTDHETTKPQWLIRQLLKDSTKQGDLVLDCFAGSGSTLRACQALGIGAVGIEKDLNYCKLIEGLLIQDKEAVGETVSLNGQPKQLGLFTEI